ncbi:SDR family NAD(P)-dependent oxidoreductase [Novosphingobium rosa]|uniref:SDR family NAD(P)-dependent oxidoreductase n=1 Tax=Novosphingobium rosa TaxID=76978 RepID=UPI000833EC89|nr:SDR family oxidoreductase [Novosphingobium rosa]
MAQELNGKTALVTGATGGLGRAICARLAQAGASVIAADLPQAPIAALVATLGAGSRALHLDVTREEQWQAAFQTCEEDGQKVDILVNNAGIFTPNIPFADMPFDVWKKHFAVNADGTFLGCREAIRHMRGRGGAIVNIASSMGLVALAEAGAYCASKAAVLMTTRVAARSGGPDGIRVNAVLPGAVPTDMLMGNLQAGQQESDLLGTLASYAAMGRLARPEDIAEAVLMLAGPGAAAISGVALPVDCGTIPGG